MDDEDCETRLRCMSLEDEGNDQTSSAPRDFLLGALSNEVFLVEVPQDTNRIPAQEIALDTLSATQRRPFGSSGMRRVQTCPTSFASFADAQNDPSPSTPLEAQFELSSNPFFIDPISSSSHDVFDTTQNQSMSSVPQLFPPTMELFPAPASNGPSNTTGSVKRASSHAALSSLATRPILANVIDSTSASQIVSSSSGTFTTTSSQFGEVSNDSALRRIKSVPVNLDSQAQDKLLRENSGYITSLEKEINQLQRELELLQARRGEVTEPVATDRHELTEIKEKIHLFHKRGDDMDEQHVQHSLNECGKIYRLSQEKAIEMACDVEKATEGKDPLSLALWMVNQGRTEEYWSRILINKVGLTPRQMSQLYERRAILQQVSENLNNIQKDARTISHELQTYVNDNTALLDQVAAVMTPIQIATFMSWVEDQELVVNMLDTVWPT